MAIRSILYILVLAALQASTYSLKLENITVLEGNSAVLNCTMNKSEGSFIEWKNPKQQVLYFNDIKALRDNRYKLVNFSSSQLIITLRKTTVDDDGVYSCLYYDHQIVKKQLKLTVLAPPLTPILNITKQSPKKKVISCITTGSKPKPQITWLLNNRLELHGRTKYKPENKGAKFTTISTLKIKSHEKNFRIDCVVRHEALMNRTLKATFRFNNNYNFIGPTELYTQTANVNETTMNPSSTPNTELPFTKMQRSTFPNETDSFTANDSNLFNSNETSTERNEGIAFNSTSTWNETSISSIENKNSTSTIKCQNNNIMENDAKYEKQHMKKNGALLLILVAFLICGLVIVFQLFVLKLWKEHLKWRKQKDESDTIGDSNRSNKSSNEENGRTENNNQGNFERLGNWKRSRRLMLHLNRVDLDRNVETTDLTLIGFTSFPYN
ncbi:cytotoxic and regulatory T-cell molecule isoform X1 [Hemitrygon akajei]|uniref:cytotoxic and regulatory T-cell molecule isoform X1 n=1 Tax=Hemitrygon akajei TaxID=2704970 RepID=UPI003BF9E0A1